MPWWISTEHHIRVWIEQIKSDNMYNILHVLHTTIHRNWCAWRVEVRSECLCSEWSPLHACNSKTVWNSCDEFSENTSAVIIKWVVRIWVVTVRIPLMYCWNHGINWIVTNHWNATAIVKINSSRQFCKLLKSTPVRKSDNWQAQNAHRTLGYLFT